MASKYSSYKTSIKPGLTCTQRPTAIVGRDRQPSWAEPYVRHIGRLLDSEPVQDFQPDSHNLPSLQYDSYDNGVIMRDNHDKTDLKRDFPTQVQLDKHHPDRINIGYFVLHLVT
jgi:hypothetical protein